MKSVDRVKKLRDMSVDELERREAEMGEQMFKLRFQWAMGQTCSLPVGRLSNSMFCGQVLISRDVVAGAYSIRIVS